MKTSLLSIAVGAALLTLVQVQTRAQESAAVPEAQEAAQEREAPKQLDNVVVTGTRLANPNLASSSPIATISGEDILRSGNVASLEKALNEQPQFVAGRTSSTYYSADGQIMSTANLRGLGAQRTLVLVDGTRYVPANTGGIVDLNTIPSALIERVETVTGGASAVYGSDAIAGVVNFVLKDDFEGVQLRGSAGQSEQGDGMQAEMGATVGGNFADGRGNVVFDLAYARRNPVFGADRDFSYNNLNNAYCAPGTLDGLGVGTVSSAADAVPCFRETGSGTLPAGKVNGNITFDENGNAISPVPSGLYDPTNRENYLQSPLERATATALAHFDVNDDLRAYGRFSYTTNKGRQHQRAVSTSVAQMPDMDINLGNPYVTDSLAALLEPLDTDGDGIVNVDVARRFLELGPRIVELHQDSYQAQFGVDGRLASNWKYDVNYSYGENRRTDLFFNEMAVSKLQQSLLATTDMAGNIVCTDPRGGCVPANIFGAGNVSAAAADFLRTTARRTTAVTQQIAGAYLSGDSSGWFELPAGPLGIVIGAEWRDLDAYENPDDILQNESLANSRQTPTRGGYTVKEIYTELEIPLLSDLPFARSLSLKGAGRYSDYSLDGVGGVFTWNSGLVYEPVADLRLRGEFQHAIRAPNVQELYQGTRSEANTVVDPCGATVAAADRSAELTALCMATGVPQDLVYGNLQPASTEMKLEYGGNPDLRAEESDTLTAGFTWSPSWSRGLTLSADYYRIKIKDAIGLFGDGASGIVGLCYDTLRDADSVYCQAINRNATTGEVLSVAANYSNIALLEISGFDVQASKTFALDFGFDGGSYLTMNLAGTYVRKWTSQAEQVADVLECAGLYGSDCGEPIPRWKVYSSLGWNSGPLDLQLRWRWTGKVKYDGQYTFANPSQGIAASYQASDAFGAEIGERSYFDLSAQWYVSDRVQLTFGVYNLLDKDPPLVGNYGGGNNTWPNSYDVLGRRFYAGFRVDL